MPTSDKLEVSFMALIRNNGFENREMTVSRTPMSCKLGQIPIG